MIQNEKSHYLMLIIYKGPFEKRVVKDGNSGARKRERGGDMVEEVQTVGTT